jgi:hypothetical protein
VEIKLEGVRVRVRLGRGSRGAAGKHGENM